MKRKRNVGPYETWSAFLLTSPAKIKALKWRVEQLVIAFNRRIRRDHLHALRSPFRALQ